MKKKQHLFYTVIYKSRKVPINHIDYIAMKITDQNSVYMFVMKRTYISKIYDYIHTYTEIVLPQITCT